MRAFKFESRKRNGTDDLIFVSRICVDFQESPDIFKAARFSLVITHLMFHHVATMNATRYLLRSAVIATTAALSMCASAEPMVTSAQQTGYLQDYYRMNHI